MLTNQDETGEKEMKSIAGRIITALIAATVCVFFCHTGRVYAASVIDNGDFKYLISEETKTAEIISYGGKSLYVSVPVNIEDYTVVSVGAAAFRENNTLKELEIPETVKEIKDCAFENCKTLEKIQIPGSVLKIGNSAFSGCRGLTDISIDDGLAELGEYAFSECTSLEKLRLPNSLDSIGNYAFLNCTSLSDPGIPKALRYFGKYALENTKWMKAQKNEFVTVGDGILIKYIGDSEVKSVSDNIKVVGSYAFAGNRKIKQIMLPSSVNSIEISAFQDCTALENVYIPSSVENIGERAFSGCTSLKTVVFPNSINTIKNSVFRDSGLESFEVPTNVSNISESAFAGCLNLSNIKMGDNVKKIGENSFKNCNMLRRVVFPETLKEIDENAFDGCNSLTRVEFNGGTTLKSCAFNECRNLLAVVFYKNPAEIDDNAFSLTPRVVIYSDNNVYLQEYASRNGKQSDSIRNLPAYDENTELISEEDGEYEFSTGYALIGFPIIVIDLALVILTSIYILFIEPKHKRKYRRKQKTVKASVNYDEPVTYVKAPGRRKTKTAVDAAKRQENAIKRHRTENNTVKRYTENKNTVKPGDRNIKKGNTRTFERQNKH